MTKELFPSANRFRFRAWHKAYQKMYFPCSIDWSNSSRASDPKHVYLWDHDGTPKDESDDFYARYWFDDLVLMQSTGLNDKNGKEIFEKDIVWNGKYDPDSGKKITYVVGYEERFVFVPSRTYVDLEYCGGGAVELERRDVSVIGNIYENTDLLPKAQ